MLPEDKYRQPQHVEAELRPVAGVFDITESGHLLPALLPAQFETDERLEAADLYRRHEEARQ